MKLGMCLLLWTTRVEERHLEMIADLKRTGFDGVEVPVFDTEPEQYRRLARQLDDLGLERTAVSAIGDPGQNLIGTRDQQQAGIDFLCRALDCAAELGATVLAGPLHSTLGQFSGQGPTREELDRSLTAQRILGQEARARGITIALEVLNRFESYLFNTMDQLCAHLEQVNDPNIRAMYDTFHANIEEADPVAAFRKNVTQIAHVHLSENDRGVPGRGHVPWGATFSALREAGYDGWLTIEAFGRGLPDLAAATKVWRDFAESPEAVYRGGHDFIRAGWAKAGAGS